MSSHDRVDCASPRRQKATPPELGAVVMVVGAVVGDVVGGVAVVGGGVAGEVVGVCGIAGISGVMGAGDEPGAGVVPEPGVVPGAGEFPAGAVAGIVGVVDDDGGEDLANPAVTTTDHLPHASVRWLPRVCPALSSPVNQ